jgi:sugar O-acyltransferase (sialic acid O-acetyltransferase NeuD family)
MLLIGGSGHAKVIMDCLEEGSVKAIFDDNKELHQLKNVNVIHGYDPNHLQQEALIISVGNNGARKKIAEKVKHRFGKAIHPSVIISRSANIGEGTVVLHGSIIQADAQIGKHCIINTAATVDHDCKLGDYVHISPNASIAGTVSIGEGTWIGAGATVINNIKIGKWCVIGAGAVVIKDIPDYSMAVGVPAKVIKKLD